jgi:hypothetical protein
MWRYLVIAVMAWSFLSALRDFDPCKDKLVHDNANGLVVVALAIVWPVTLGTAAGIAVAEHEVGECKT